MAPQFETPLSSLARQTLYQMQAGQGSGQTRLTFLFTLSTKIVDDMRNKPTSSIGPPNARISIDIVN